MSDQLAIDDPPAEVVEEFEQCLEEEAQELLREYIAALEQSDDQSHQLATIAEPLTYVTPDRQPIIFNLTMPEQPPAVVHIHNEMPEQTAPLVTIQSPEIHIPAQAAPTITVNVPEQKPPEVNVTVEAAKPLPVGFAIQRDSEGKMTGVEPKPVEGE